MRTAKTPANKVKEESRLSAEHQRYEFRRADGQPYDYDHDRATRDYLNTTEVDLFIGGQRVDPPSPDALWDPTMIHF